MKNSIKIEHKEVKKGKHTFLLLTAKRKDNGIIWNERKYYGIPLEDAKKHFNDLLKSINLI